MSGNTEASPGVAGQQQSQWEQYVQSTVQQATGSLTSHIHHLQAEVQQLRQSNHSLSQQVAASSSTPRATSASTSSGTAVRSRKVVHPDKYGGEPGAHVLVHLTAMEDYFASLNLTDEKEMLNSAAELHTDKAKMWWFNMGSLEQRPTTWEGYKTLLKKRFQGVMSDMVAFTQLEQHKQTTSVSAYASQFETYAVLAGYNAQKPDDNLYLRRRFIVGLKFGVRNKVMDKNPATFEDALTAAFQEESRYATNKQLDDGPSSSSKGHSHSRPNHSATSTGPAPMELGAAEVHSGRPNGQARGDRPRLPRANISEEELKRRRDNNLCIYCGSPKHKIKDCGKRLEDAKTMA